MLFTEIYLFLKQKKLVLLCILFTIFMWGMGLNRIYTYDREAVACLRYTIELAPISFMFFILFSYFYSGQNCRQGIAEIISSAPKGFLYFSLYKIVVIQIWNVLLTTGFISMQIMINKRFLHNSKEFTLFCVGMWILYHFLPNLLASLAGLFFAGIENKRTAYAGLIIGCFLFAGDFTTFLRMLSWKTNAFDNIATFFSVFARGTQNTPNYYYLLSMEQNNWVRVFFWIVFFFTILMIQAKSGIQRNCGFVLLTLVLFCIYIQPFGAPYCDEHSYTDAWTTDQSYYALSQYEGETRDAGFQVLSYDMNFKVNRILYADVKVKPDRTDLPEYAFTLYHGYHIRSVKDQDGKKLNFTRQKDYFLVENPDKNLSEITIRYYGFSKSFYSTSQGIWMPAYFVYYPQSGMRKIFNNEEYEYVIKDTDDISHYRFRIQSAIPIYTSLEAQEDGSYEGDSDGVTILGGIFAKEYKEKDYRVIYSSLEYNEAEIHDYAAEYIEPLIKNHDLSTVFLTPYIAYETTYCGTDHITALNLTDPESAERLHQKIMKKE